MLLAVISVTKNSITSIFLHIYKFVIFWGSYGVELVILKFLSDYFIILVFIFGVLLTCRTLVVLPAVWDFGILIVLLSHRSIRLG